MPRTKSITELQEELDQKEKQLAKLQARRDKLAKDLEGIDRQIAQLGGKAAPANGRRKKAAKKVVRKKRRATGAPSLADVLARVMVNKGNVKVVEAAKLAVGAGYKSKSSQFGNIVSQTLSVDKRFKKIARGIYVLKGEGKTAVKRTKKTAKKIGKKAAKPKAKGAKKRRKYSETAEQFILGLLKGKAATSAEINAAWMKARTGRADNTLNKLLKAKKVKREKLPKGKGSTYSLA